MSLIEIDRKKSNCKYRGVDKRYEEGLGVCVICKDSLGNQF
jgi:hypothetical protein